MKYRADIDGLRALAIIPVVLFHAGYEWFSGGFVGVDVFFVISGYLITNILMKDLVEKRFSLVSFYKRRARRILPAYFTMLTVVAIFGYYLFLPSEFTALSKSILSSVTFVSNIYFWQNSGYFSIESEFSPFLHTWSLSVEEQFYIFFPLALAVLYRYFSRRVICGFIVCGFFCSTFISIMGVSYSATAFYYIMPSRAWELLIGSILALGIIPKLKNNLLNEIVALIGFAMIILTVVNYTESIVFPGWAATIPVFGAAMLIYSGSAGSSTYVNKFLEHKLLVFVGLMSYSLYLWHWPIFVFMKNIFGNSLSDFTTIFAIALSCLLAWVSLIFIERPFIIQTYRLKLFPTLGLSSVIIIVCLVSILNNGFPTRFKPSALLAESSLKDKSPRLRDCHSNRGENIAYSDKCIFGAEVPPVYAFWGDSHAMELSDSLGRYVNNKELSGVHISYSGCPPSQNFSLLYRPACKKHNKDILTSLMKDRSIKTVFLIAKYNNYMRDSEMSQLMLNGFEQTILALKSTGKRVVVIYPIPGSNGLIPLDIARKLQRNISTNDYGQSLEEYKRENNGILIRLDQIIEGNGLGVIKPEHTLCADGHLCKFHMNGIITHFDDNHLSISGAELFVPELFKFLEE